MRFGFFTWNFSSVCSSARLLFLLLLLLLLRRASLSLVFPGLPWSACRCVQGRKLLCSARRRWRTNLGNHRRTCRAPSCVSSCCCLPAATITPQFPPTGPPSLDESHPLIIHFILSFIYFINSSFHVFRLLVMEFSPPSVVTLHPSLA